MTRSWAAPQSSPTLPSAPPRASTAKFVLVFFMSNMMAFILYSLFSNDRVIDTPLMQGGAGAVPATTVVGGNTGIGSAVPQSPMHLPTGLGSEPGRMQGGSAEVTKSPPPRFTTWRNATGDANSGARLPHNGLVVILIRGQAYRWAVLNSAW